MKKKLSGLVLAGALVVTGVSISYAATTSWLTGEQAQATPVPEEKKTKMKQALDNRLEQVATDLRQQGRIPADYVQYDYHSINQAPDLIRDSALTFTEARNLVGYYMPQFFVKPDATAFAVGYKNGNGDNEVVHYTRHGNKFVEVESLKSHGVTFTKSLDEVTQ